MASSRSHSGGLRRWSIAAWAAILLVLAFTLFATFSSASPIGEKKQKMQKTAAESPMTDVGVKPHGLSFDSPTKNMDGDKDQLLEAGPPNAFASPVADTSSSSFSDDPVVRVQSFFTDYFSDNYNRINVPLRWQRTISGGVLMGVGLFLTLCGFRYQRFTLLSTGFIGGAIAAYAILYNVEPAQHWSNRVLIYCAVCIAAGLLVGVTMVALNRWAVWVLSGAGGLVIGVYILSWRDGTLIHNGAGRIGLLAGGVALGAFLGLFLGKPIIVLATVLYGGYMFTLGLDMFLRTGFLENYKNMFRSGGNVDYALNGGIYGMLGILSFMFLIGALIQFLLFARHWRNERLKARAAAVPPVNGSSGPYYNNNRNSQYGGGSQYGSSDHLVLPNAGASHGEKRKYNWWGKRINKNPPAPQNQPYYHNEKYGGSQPTIQQRQAAAAAPVVVGASHVGAAGVGTGAVDGDTKMVVFEEKKDWLGRTKFVPKLVPAGTVADAASIHTASVAPAQSIAASNATGAPAQGASLPTVVYKEKTNWRGEHKLVSVVDKKPTTVDMIHREIKTEKKAKNAPAVSYTPVVGSGNHVGTYTMGAASTTTGRRREKAELLEDDIKHPTVPLGPLFHKHPRKSSMKKDTHIENGKKSFQCNSFHKNTTVKEPRVTFSEAMDPTATTTHGNDKRVRVSGVQDKSQQQQQQFFAQGATMQPQLQPNNFYASQGSGYNPYGHGGSQQPYYPPASQSQDQMSYILLGVDGKNPALLENVESLQEALPEILPQPQPQSAAIPPVVTATATTTAPEVVTPADTTVPTTAKETTTTGKSAKLKGTSMSKLFGRQSGEHSDPIKDRNTDGLATTTH